MASTLAAPPADLTNERVAYARLLALGLQHVLVMYAGTVAVPLIVGSALHLPKGIVMFGMVAATGVRILGSIDFNRYRHNLFIVAIAIGFGTIPTLAPTFFQYLPRWLEPATHSGIVLGTLVAVILNLYYNGMQPAEHAMRAAAATTHSAE
ncbi:hypothetical protein E7Z57_08340 [Ralstonia pseudosolanacearum]|uniref:Purine permease n=1 Tax=Ralstonia solanacearum TaxID=305 RepID=A0AA92ECV1_RALSL|nr:hypothetical protein E7Z57_08340 [Ralstonia pseudosolanacearum]